jgi:plastocyanin
MKTKTAVVLVVLATLVLTLAGCSSNNKVGNKALLDVKDEASKGLGQTTTTQAPTATTAGVALGVGKQTTSTRPVATTAAPKVETATVITINGDNSNVPQFDPTPASVYVGGLVKWTNNDKKDRSVVAINPANAFRSPDIPPGGSYTWRATAAGTYDYQDGTRPYANGQVQVVAR